MALPTPATRNSAAIRIRAMSGTTVEFMLFLLSLVLNYRANARGGDLLVLVGLNPGDPDPSHTDAPRDYRKTALHGEHGHFHHDQPAGRHAVLPCLRRASRQRR